MELGASQCADLDTGNGAARQKSNGIHLGHTKPQDERQYENQRGGPSLTGEGDMAIRQLTPDEQQRVETWALGKAQSERTSDHVSVVVYRFTNREGSAQYSIIRTERGTVSLADISQERSYTEQAPDEPLQVGCVQELGEGEEPGL
jgi:hypothetical protein